MLHELVSTFETPYVPFPVNPRTIEVCGNQVYEYICPTAVKKYIENLAREVDLHSFDQVLLNMNGGVFLFEHLSRLQNYKRDPVKIEYHRPERAYGAIITIPVPPELKNSKVLVIDDVYDTGGTLRAIMDSVGPSSQAVTLVTKKDIPNQIKIPNIVIGVEIDNKWIGGCGMDMGISNEEESFRSYSGIVVKIPRS